MRGPLKEELMQTVVRSGMPVQYLGDDFPTFVKGVGLCCRAQGQQETCWCAKRIKIGP